MGKHPERIWICYENVLMGTKGREKKLRLIGKRPCKKRRHRPDNVRLTELETLNLNQSKFST